MLGCIHWGEGGLFYRPMIRSQSFGEPMPLDCQLHKRFSVFFFSPLLCGTGWQEWDGMARQNFPSPGRLGSNTPEC